MSERKRRGRGECSVSWFEPRQCFRARVYLAGKRYTVYGQTETEAREKMHQLELKAASGMSFEASTLSCPDYLAHWLSTTVTNSTAPTTAARYAQIVNLHLAPRLATVALAKLTPLHIETLYADMAKAGVSPGNRRKISEVLVNALNRAVTLKLIPYNPATGVKRPKVERTEIAILDHTQAKALLAAAAGNRLEALFITAIYTGLREGELFGLQWPDIDFIKSTISVHRSLAQLKARFLLKEPKSKRSRRTIDVPAAVLNALNTHRQAMLAEGQDVKTGQVFVTTTRNFIGRGNLLQKVFKPLLAKAGLQHIRFHDLRHTHASHLLHAGNALQEVSRRLGHYDEAFTLKTYAHLLPASGDKLRSSLADLYA